MKPSRYSQTILLAFFVGTFAFAAQARGRNSFKYDGVVGFGSQLLHLDDGCLAVDGTVTSGKFFEDLKRTDLDGRFEYRKQGRVVTEYPESVTTSIRLVGDRCAAELSNSPSAVFRGNSYSLRFEVEWKREMELRPAALSAVGTQCIGTSSVAAVGGNLRIPAITCQLTVDSKRVPIGDHLIVSIFTADGKRLTRMSAAP